MTTFKTAYLFSPSDKMFTQIPGRLSLVFVSLMFTLGLSGCQKNKEISEPKKPKKAPVLSLNEMDVQPIILPELKNVPTVKDTQDAFAKILPKYPILKLDVTKKSSHNIRLVFRAKAQPGPSKTQLVALNWFCVVMEKLATGESALPRAKGQYVVQLVPKEKQSTAQPVGGVPMAQSLHKVMRQSVDDCTRAIASQWTLAYVPTEKLGDHITKDMPQESAELALSRIRDAKLKSMAVNIRPLLLHKSPSVVLLAMSILAQFKDVASDAQMVEAATILSRSKRKTAYIASLYQLGTLNGPIGRQYLQTVANSHQKPAITKAAKVALGQSTK